MLSNDSSSQALKGLTQEGQNVEDNMSISMLVARRYKKNIQINKLKTPEEAANVVIKDVKEFNVNDEEYTEGSPQEREMLKQ